MTQGSESSGWFEGSDRELSASAALKEINDSVFGEIVEQFHIDYVPFGKKEPAKDERTGETIQQLVVVIQTNLSGWEKVAKVPTDDDGNDLPADRDTGRRAVYVRKFTNLWSAVGKACKEAEAKDLLNGGKLGVQLIDKEDVGKGNPKNVFRAKYVSPAPAAASNEFFDSPGNTVQAAPAAPVQQAANDPWATPTPAQPVADEPPF